MAVAPPIIEQEIQAALVVVLDRIIQETEQHQVVLELRVKEMLAAMEQVKQTHGAAAVVVELVQLVQQLPQSAELDLLLILHGDQQHQQAKMSAALITLPVADPVMEAQSDQMLVVMAAVDLVATVEAELLEQQTQAAVVDHGKEMLLTADQESSSLVI